MHLGRAVRAAAPLLLLAALAHAQAANEAYLLWNKDEATRIGAAMRRTDNVGNRMSFRGLRTERAISYKMRATWMTPDAIRATARLLQLNERMGPDQARALVAQAEAIDGTVMLVELDPDEGSGVIPLDWLALLQPKGLPRGAAGAVKGVVSPKLRDVRALGGVLKRDYAYDLFWVVFPLRTDGGAPLFGRDADEAELIVNIQGREGVVSWLVPESIRRRSLGGS